MPVMYYGAQYYRPPFPGEECWQRDFDRMQSMGFTCVKLWAVWNWIEREPGEFRFEELDRLVAMAKEHGLKVILNTIPEGAPYWTDTGNPDDLYQTADGRHVAYGGPANLPTAGWPGRCIDDDAFTALAASFIEQTARHFAREEAIAAIDVWNEPHLEPMYDYRPDLLCYCPHSRARFRSWLREKYGTLEALNAAWCRTYRDWQEVEPPPRFGTWTDMLDWRKFWLWNMRRWLDIRVQASRRGAPDIPVQTHVAYSGILGNRIVGGLGNELGDEFDLARGVDIFGLSSFPAWLMGEEHIYRHFLHSSMIAEAAHGKPFYQVELQGGAGKPGLLGGLVPTVRDVTLWNWNTIASGGKGSVYWQYAPEPAGLESPGFGLTGFQGESTPRSEAAAFCARTFTGIPELKDARAVGTLNAIYVSRSSDLLCFAADRQEKLYAAGLSGAFQAAYRASVPVRFFHQDYIDELPDSGIQTLYLPMPLVMNTHETEVLRRFVEAGGTLVSEACPGLYREDGMLEQRCDALRELFHLRHLDIEASPDWGAVTARWLEDGTPIMGCLYRQVVKPDEDVRVLAVFEDGAPAVTECRLGLGRAVWIGTYVSNAFETLRDPSSAKAILRWFQPQGYAMLRQLCVTHGGTGQIPLAPVVRLLENDTSLLLVSENPTAVPVSIRAGFVRPQTIASAEDGGSTLCWTVPPESGHITVWKKEV